MEWLNYHHLLYFWVVAREGSIARASQELRLAQPTISGQIRALEEALGEKLFVRSGRHLVLTEVGRVVFRYADDIFSLGRELLDTVKGRPTGRPLRFVVGIADVVPKHIAHRLLEPALALEEPVRMVCREDKADRLLAELALHNLDMVITDAPLGAGMKIKAYSHLLGECGVSFLAAPSVSLDPRRPFPACLDGAPFLLPAEGTMLRRSLEQWFESERIRPRVVGEFDDSALIKVFGQAGAGVVVAPSVIEKEVEGQYDLRIVGSTDAVKERFYAITGERKIKNPATNAVASVARKQIFG
ncbi:transcriptional activator NhaR [Polyangium spumosum]|uniref:Transcriptional activator NhaR n=1 Tax=Polyangium spumosum TaxID=889282 RepID=A0A6N7PL78_9BACT|nr:transcriptional activator NhaR [Polyangium spumosum]